MTSFGTLRPTDRQERKSGHFHQRIENPKARLTEKLKRFSGFSVLYTVDNAHPNVIQCELYIHAKSYGKTDSGIRVDGKDLLIRILLGEKSHDTGTDRCLPDAALAGDRNNLGLVLHKRPPCPFRHNST